MARLLIDAAVKYFKEKGDSAITRTFLYNSCRKGKMPHFRVGNRFVLDTDLVEDYLNKLQSESIKEPEPEHLYGQLRKVF